MRLGIDASNLRAGGGITHLVGLLREANPLEHGIGSIIVWGPSGTLARLIERPWLTKVEVPSLNRSLPARAYWRMFQLPGLAEQYCDVLLSPGAGFARGTKPVVTMFRNMLPFEPRERRRYGWSWMSLRLLLLRPLQLRSFRRAAGVIFLTDYAQSKVTAEAGRLNGRTAVIPHGIDEAFKSPPRPQRSLASYSNEHPFRLLYVSIVDVYKHQWTVARAVAELRREGLPVSLDLFGPAYAPALEQLNPVLEEVDPAAHFIRYHGAVKTAELPQLYHSADAFVFASSCENLPNILIEAMAAGLPIACSNRPPMPEVLGKEGGVYFDPEDVRGTTKALRELVTDVKLREGFARVSYGRAGGYSWKRCASETLGFVGRIGQLHCTGDHRHES